MNNIIENKITLLGDFDTIQEILKRIKSNESERKNKIFKKERITINE